MNKRYLLFAAIAPLFMAGAAFAQDEATIAPEEIVTIEDLGVPEPTLLPTSPFYFFKEMGRGVQNLFSFGPTAKAELQLRIANEKAAEIKKITQKEPQNSEAVQKALANYQKSQENLRKKLESLKETSQNPKVDELLSKLTERTVKHEKLFDEISLKFGDKELIKEAVNKARTGSEELVGKASQKDDPAKFAARLEKVLLKEKGGDLKNARSVEIIDRLSGKTPEAIKESLTRLRDDFSDKLKMDIEKLVQEKGENVLEEKLSTTPGDLIKRSVIIEEIRSKAGKEMTETLNKAVGQMEKVLQKDADSAQKAKEQIRRAEQAVKDAEQKAVAANLLNEAKEHLKNAQTAFDQKKYGEAFGQARSAEVLAKNAIKTSGEAKPETENFEQRLKELTQKLNTYENLLKERNFTRELNKDAYALLDNASMHLGYAKDAFTKGDMTATKLHIGHVKDFLSKLSRIIEAK